MDGEGRHRIGRIDSLRSDLEDATPGFTSRRSAEGSFFDFSHGDVRAFPPPAWALEEFIRSVGDGTDAYTDYGGSRGIRSQLVEPLRKLLVRDIESEENIIITPGTQGALFLALSSLIEQGDQVGVPDPDYFSTQRIIRYLGGQPVYLPLEYLRRDRHLGVDIEAWRTLLIKNSVRVLCVSHPNNPTGLLYDRQSLVDITNMCRQNHILLILDQLYCRLLYPDSPEYIHAHELSADNMEILSLVGPSKTESLSGFRVGVGVGPAWLIRRMTEVLSISSLRAGGYSQSVLLRWLDHDQQWLSNRIQEHQHLRNAAYSLLTEVPGLNVRLTEAGSYLFPHLPPMRSSVVEFTRRLRDMYGVKVTAGALFGERSPSAFRINFSQDKSFLLEGLQRTIEAIQEDLL